jgi:hypothetical protein
MMNTRQLCAAFDLDEKDIEKWIKWGYLTRLKVSGRRIFERRQCIKAMVMNRLKGICQPRGSSKMGDAVCDLLNTTPAIPSAKVAIMGGSILDEQDNGDFEATFGSVPYDRMAMIIDISQWQRAVADQPAK